MSSTATSAPSGAPITVPGIAGRKVRHGAEPLVMVTAYDAPGARIASEAGVDLILVGDSVAMVVLGYDDTLQVTVDDMAHHVAAVARTKPRASPMARMCSQCARWTPLATLIPRRPRCSGPSIRAMRRSSLRSRPPRPPTRRWPPR